MPIDTDKWWNEAYDERGYFTEAARDFSFYRPDIIDRFDLEGCRILELGFGYGKELIAFCKLSRHVFGCELSHKACRLAQMNAVRERVPRPSVEKTDGVTIPFEGPFDFIYSSIVLQHMSKADAIALVELCRKRLKKGGVICMELFGWEQFVGEDLEDVFSGNEETGMFNNAYTPEQIQRLFNPDEVIPWVVEWQNHQIPNNFMVIRHRGWLNRITKR